MYSIREWSPPWRSSESWKVAAHPGLAEGLTEGTEASVRSVSPEPSVTIQTFSTRCLFSNWIVNTDWIAKIENVRTK